jgi:hypothetical protein
MICLEKGLDHVAESILSFLDAESLCAAELVCKEWYRVISEGMLWKKLIERKVRTDSLWRGLAERRGWIQYLFKPKPGETLPNHAFYRTLFPKIIQDIEVRCCELRELAHASPSLVTADGHPDLVEQWGIRSVVAIFKAHHQVTLQILSAPKLYATF